VSRNGDTGHCCLIPDFRGNGFSFSPLTTMLMIGLSHIAFTMLSYIPAILNFLRAFIMKWCWILSKAFSASTEMTKLFLCLFLLMWFITFIDLYMLNDPCNPGVKLTLLW
jgi:hypothetical protein